ncbi:MAG TPA: response regulator [Planctomycetota bacterium]|nr:response regulator [Planctomycetota bacterium]
MTEFAVLLVEDEVSDRLMMELAFDKVAPSVRLRCAVDGAEAIDYLSGQGAYGNRTLHPLPQLVLLDLKLPKKSGFDVLEWMRSEPNFKHVPVIVLTSSEEPGDLERAYALGATSYLVKSIDTKSMRDVVRGIGEYAALIGTAPERRRMHPLPGLREKGKPYNPGSA